MGKYFLIVLIVTILTVLSCGSTIAYNNHNKKSTGSCFQFVLFIEAKLSIRKLYK